MSVLGVIAATRGAASRPNRCPSRRDSRLRFDCSYALLTNMTTPTPAGYATGRALRPSAKSLPEHARSHNRSLVLQTLYRFGRISRADLARETGLTRVTISDLVAELIGDDLVIELGQRGGRPARQAGHAARHQPLAAYEIIGIDLSDHAVLRGGVLDLDGTSSSAARCELENASGAGGDRRRSIALAQSSSRAATAPDPGHRRRLAGCRRPRRHRAQRPQPRLERRAAAGDARGRDRPTRCSSPTTRTPPRSPSTASATRSAT